MAKRHHWGAGAHHKQVDDAHKQHQHQQRMNGFEHPINGVSVGGKPWPEFNRG